MVNNLSLNEETLRNQYQDEPISSESLIEAAIPDGMLVDYISRELIKDTPKEQVRQNVARSLLQEYGISVDDMSADFPVSVDGKNKKVSIAIFKSNEDHTTENIRRVVVCEREPINSKSKTPIRDYEQAKKDLTLLEGFLSSIPNCQYGLWTNGLEFFYLEKKVTRFDVEFIPLGDWPMGDESLGTKFVASDARMRKATPEMLKITFRRCHNFIHGNEGMPKDAAFWQFLYLIFSKMYDERSPKGKRRFWVGPTEQFTEDGWTNIRERIEPIFEEVKDQYSSIFTGNEVLSLSDRALAFMASELSRYDLTTTSVDAKGAAYQEIVGNNVRGDSGQFFTPRAVISMAVAMIDPKPHEIFLDPAAGTGGFLVEAVSHITSRFKAQLSKERGKDVQEDDPKLLEKISDYASKKIFGSDFDPFLVRTAQMSIHLASDGKPNVYYVNSLELPHGYLSGVEDANENIPLGSIDVIATNPPFGSKIPVTDKNILERYELAHVWKKHDDGTYRMEAKVQNKVAPEILFIERVIQFLKPGGRAAIVLPNGLLSNASDAYIRQWIIRNSQVLASVDLPMETFIPDADVNILTSVLFLRKRTEAEIRSRALGAQQEESVFFAVAEKVGYDRRGLTLYERTPEGKLLLKKQVAREKVRVGGEFVERDLIRMEPSIDNDLPKIADAWHALKQFGGIQEEG